MPKRLTQEEYLTIFALNFHAGWSYNAVENHIWQWWIPGFFSQSQSDKSSEKDEEEQPE